jgi:hypothetical protein
MDTDSLQEAGFVVEAGVAGGDPGVAGEAEVFGGAVDPAGGPFELDEDADGGFVEGGVAAFAGAGEFGAELFVMPGLVIAEGGEDGEAGIEAGERELVFDAALVASGGFGSFESAGGGSACLAEAEEQTTGAEGVALVVEDDVFFEDAGGDDAETMAAEQGAGFGGGVEAEFDFDFEGRFQGNRIAGAKDGPESATDGHRRKIQMLNSHGTRIHTDEKGLVNW